MTSDLRIDVDTELLRKCMSSECAWCREDCPSYQGFQLDSYSSRGKNRALEAYVDGDLSEEDIIDSIFACTTCGQCEDVCLTGGSFYNQVYDLREQLNKAGMGPKGHGEMVAYIRKHSTPYGRETKIPSPDASTTPFGRPLRIAYFPGCSLQAELPELIPHTQNVLRCLGIETKLLTQPCCGLPVLNAGFLEDAAEMSNEFVEEVRSRKIKKIITSCSGCAVMLRTHLNRLTGSKIKVEHITEVLGKEDDRIRSVYGDVGEGRSVLFHDPCDLARKLDIFEWPRIVLSALGFISQEFTNIGSSSSCCGGGGGFGRDYPDEASVNARNRVEEAKQRGIDTIVSACFSCRRMFRSVRSLDVEISDIMELFPEKSC